MKTREIIKETSRVLFNAKGLMHVTLRDVADEMGKSYGNITYHFRTKALVIEALYADMMAELTVATSPDQLANHTIFTLPTLTYKISIRYLFFYFDYMELHRNFPAFMRKVERDNKKRMLHWRPMLKQLQQAGILDSELNDDDLDYLMDISGVVRTFYFQQHYPNKMSEKGYLDYVNKLLFPYLTAHGRKVYASIKK